MSENPVNIQTFPSAHELATKLADEIAGNLTKAITARGKASMVVSGGSTPRPLFKQLSLKTIDWQKVFITLADERWVETTDSASNELLVRSLLLQNEAASARFVGLKNSSPSARGGERKCHEAVGSIPRPFDAIILGMGDDGHTASLFPGAEELTRAVDMQSNRNCIALSPSNAPHARMTLTLPVLLDCKAIFLHITGDRKKKVLEKALGEGSTNDMPIRWILQQQTPVRIFWSP